MRAVIVVATVLAGLFVLPSSALAVDPHFDLEVTNFSSSGSAVPEEGPVTYNVAVRNNGPDSADNVDVDVTPPAPLFQFVSATVSNTQVGDKVTLHLGTIANGATTTASTTWNGIHPGSGTATANASAIGTDSPNQNNLATLPTTVTGLTASAAAFPAQIIGTGGPLMPVVITNHSAVPTILTLSAATGDTGDFGFGTGCGSLLPALTGSCTLNLRFFPSALGARLAHLTFSGSGNVDGVTTDLSGTGLPFPTTAGPTGPQGPAGPAGPAGAPAFKLVVVPVSAKLRARAGKKVTFSYVSTLNATATLDVLKGSKRVARVSGQAKTGVNKLRWNGKVGRKAAGAGRYTLKLTAVNGDQKATASSKLTLARR
jgi:uncharacterized repeat protein (TIGR01451 family)